MNKTTKFFIGLALLAMVGQQAMAAEKTSVKQYRKNKENLEAAYSTFDINNRMSLFRAIEQITRSAWSGLQGKLIDKRIVPLGNGRYEMAFYDYDKDRESDQFRLSTLDGKILPQDFGFIYDLNRDRRIDYIVYFGGSMITNDGGFDYYFYHWLDTDRDGRIDACANTIYIHDGESHPSPERVFWVLDTDGDGKPDRVDYIDGHTGENTQLPAEEGVWHYNSLFGPKEISAQNANYFNQFTDYLNAVNSTREN